MKIFEAAWLTIAGISLIMGLYYTIVGNEPATSSLYLFVITGLGILMFFIKRKSRHFLGKRKAKEQEENQ